MFSPSAALLPLRYTSYHLGMLVNNCVSLDRLHSAQTLLKKQTNCSYSVNNTSSSKFLSNETWPHSVTPLIDWQELAGTLRFHRKHIRWQTHPLSVRLTAVLVNATTYTSYWKVSYTCVSRSDYRRELKPVNLNIKPFTWLYHLRVSSRRFSRLKTKPTTA